MGQTVTQGSPGHNKLGLSMLSGQTSQASTVPCPFSVLLCKFEVVSSESVVTTRRNIRETKRKGRERVRQDGIRIADLSPVSPMSHPGTVWRRRTAAETSRQSRFALNLIC
jgi:hypothetical protein